MLSHRACHFLRWLLRPSLQRFNLLATVIPWLLPDNRIIQLAIQIDDDGKCFARTVDYKLSKLRPLARFTRRNVSNALADVLLVVVSASFHVFLPTG